MKVLKKEKPKKLGRKQGGGDLLDEFTHSKVSLSYLCPLSLPSLFYPCEF